ncbi:MAG: glycosyltransferase family 4 protein [Planctomycetota bacterium]
MSTSITVMNRLFWPKRFGGLERVLWQLTNALADAGVTVQVLSEQHDTAVLDEDARERLRVLRTPPVEFGRLWRVAELVQVRWWMRALAKAPRTRWLWANEPTAAAAAIFSGRASDLIYRPVFCYAGMHHVAQSYPEMAALKRSRVARLLDRLAYRRAHLVIDESRCLQQQQERWYGQRANLCVVHNATTPASPAPTDCPRLRFGLHPGHFVIGFVGRPGDPCKDLPFLLDALAHRPLPAHARLLIVGGGEGFNTARQWVQKAGLAPHTLWTGNLDDPGPAYHAMDALVLPSRFETFGNVIIEAHAHGVPAIGRRYSDRSDAPIYTACSELIDHDQTGYTVSPHDPADLADKLYRLIVCPAHAKRMGAEARRRQMAYPWSQVVSEYLHAMGEWTPSDMADYSIAA